MSSNLVNWGPAGDEAYAEACRAVPGLLAAKTRGDMAGARLLLQSYHQMARDLGLAECQAWTVLFSATMHWYGQTVQVLSRDTDQPVEAVLQSMGMVALDWAATGG